MKGAKKKLTADEFVSFGDVSKAAVSRVVFQIVDGGSLVTSAVPKARIKGLAATELISVPYVNRATGATVAAGTAITAEGLYEVDATGVEVGLQNDYTSGDGTVHYQTVEG